jgi:phenylalanyl-tRNA synthetase alpha chain
MLIATLQTFLEEYYGKKLEVRVNPFYFPFTEPSFEFALSCPFCGAETEGSGESKDKACKVCSGEGWIELLGCGMIHPNVLKAADIDPNVYTGFAFGCGIDRLVMMKHAIEDVRHFESAKLDFLRQF